MTDFSNSKGAKTLYNYFVDFIENNEFGTSNYSSETGKKKYQDLFIDFLEWADSVNSGDAPLEVSSLIAEYFKLTTGAGAGKILTSDADGDATWQSPPSGTVPSSGSTAGVLMIGDGADGWNVSTAKVASGTMLELPNQTSLQSTIPTDNTRVYSYDDGASVHLMATKDDNATESQIKLAEQTDIMNLGRGSIFYCGDGTDKYIYVPHDSKLNLGTNDFAIIFKNLTLGDYTPRYTQTLVRKAVGDPSYTGLISTLETDGKPQIAFGNGSDFNTTYKSSVAISAGNGTPIHLAVTVKRETASVNGEVKFYEFTKNYWRLLSTVTIPANESPINLNNDANVVLFQNIDGTTEYSFASLSGFAILNYVPTASEILDMVSSKKISPIYLSGGDDIQSLQTFTGTLDSWGTLNAASQVTNEGGTVLRATAIGSGSFGTKKTFSTPLLVKEDGKLWVTFKHKGSVPGSFGYCLAVRVSYYGGEYSKTFSNTNGGSNITTDWTTVNFYIPVTKGKSVDYISIFVETASDLTGEWFEIDDLRIYQPGCLVSLEEHGAGHYSWLGSSNNIHAQISGAALCGVPANHRQTIVKTGILNSPVGTATIPAGYIIKSIRAKGSTSITGVKIGTSSGGEQIVAETTVGTTPKILILASTANDGYSESANTTIYIVHSTGDGATLDVYIRLERMY